MKLFVLALVALLSYETASAAKKRQEVVRAPTSTGTEDGPPAMSAFAHNGTLYLTLLRSCNRFAGSLDVAENCKKDRAMKNLAPICGARLSMMMTAMGCPKNFKPVVQVMEVSLEDVAPEAELLRLKVFQHELEVRLK